MEIICARHGRTAKVVETQTGLVCGHERSKYDQAPKAKPNPDKEKLRVLLGIAEDVCGRDGLPECPDCLHPAHESPGLIAIEGVTVPFRHACGSFEDHADGTKWCPCGRPTPPTETLEA